MKKNQESELITHKKEFDHITSIAQTPCDLFNSLKKLMALIKKTKNVSDFYARKGFYKELRDEVIPIAEFAAAHYANSENIKIKLCMGNQPYDAEIYQNDVFLEKLEITNITDSSDRLLDRKGFAIKADSPEEKQARLEKIFDMQNMPALPLGENLWYKIREDAIKIIKKKFEKNYDDQTILVFHVYDTVNANIANIDNSKKTFMLIKAEIQKYNFSCKDVYLYIMNWDGNNHYEKIAYNNQNTP